MSFRHARERARLCVAPTKLCVAPAVELPVDGDICSCESMVVPCMTMPELEHIERNVMQGYRWGCDMRALIEELKFRMVNCKGCVHGGSAK